MSSSVVKILVGNKVDKEFSRQVSTARGGEICRAHVVALHRDVREDVGRRERGILRGRRADHGHTGAVGECQRARAGNSTRQRRCAWGCANRRAGGRAEARGGMCVLRSPTMSFSALLLLGDHILLPLFLRTVLLPRTHDSSRPTILGSPSVCRVMDFVTSGSTYSYICKWHVFFRQSQSLSDQQIDDKVCASLFSLHFLFDGFCLSTLLQLSASVFCLLW